jgi:hypothetical protein
MEITEGTVGDLTGGRFGFSIDGDQNYEVRVYDGSITRRD